MVVSSTSMKVGITTAAATTQGLIVRGAATLAGAALSLPKRSLLLLRLGERAAAAGRRAMRSRGAARICAAWNFARGPGLLFLAVSAASSCKNLPAFGPVGVSL